MLAACSGPHQEELHHWYADCDKNLAYASCDCLHSSAAQAGFSCELKCKLHVASSYAPQLVLGHPAALLLLLLLLVLHLPPPVQS
jgi:hypothetical protein